MLKTGSIYNAIDVFKHLLLLGTDKKLSSAEKKMMQNAERAIISELHLATGWSLSEVESKIDCAAKGIK